jgi:hypothetical protein
MTIAALGQSMRHQIAGFYSWKTLVREGLETTETSLLGATSHRF